MLLWCSLGCDQGKDTTVSTSLPGTRTEQLNVAATFQAMADWPGPYPKLAVGAYYYPWYNKEKWLSPVTLTPTVGRYISADKAVVQRHLFEAAAAGLQFLLCSWDRPESFIDTNVTALFSLLSDGSPLHLAILYESAIALNVSPESIDFAAPAAEGKTIGDVFVEQMCFLAEHYCTRPGYLRIAGRPLIYLYLVRNYHHAGPYLAKARALMREKGLDPYLVADVVFWGDPANRDWKMLSDNFRAITGYNMYTDAMRVDSKEYIRRVGEQYDRYARTAASHGLAFIPDVQPGYDDTNLRGRERPIFSRDGGVFYVAFWKKALGFVDSGTPLLFLTSFNEWFEGTSLEPSLAFGSDYLMLTRVLLERSRGAWLTTIDQEDRAGMPVATVRQ